MRGELNSDQELFLWLGVGRDGFPFENDDEARASWQRHAPRLMELFATRGRRPMAWWWFDAPIPYPGYDLERSILYEAGLLGEQERESLISEWREEFERAQAPSFGFCAGLRPDGKDVLWLTGQAGREALYAWADIPASLIAQWRTEFRLCSDHWSTAIGFNLLGTCWFVGD